MCKFNCPIRVNSSFCYYCFYLINTAGAHSTLSDKKKTERNEVNLNTRFISKVDEKKSI